MDATTKQILMGVAVAIIASAAINRIPAINQIVNGGN